MTCLEAQSKIIAYIEQNLDKDEKMDFLRHVQCCDNCKEELNIYYTMIEGMHQLDNNLPLSKDFTKELNQRMDQELKSNRKKKGLFRSSVVVAVTGGLCFLIFAYVNFLNLVHEDEQAKIKAAQGEYYYSDTFKDILFEPEDEKYTLNMNVKEEPMHLYEKIRQYNMLKE